MNGDNEFQGFVDFDEVESDTYLGDDTFRLDDEWGDWDTNAKTFDPDNDGGEVRGGGGGGCDPGTPPDTGTWIFASIDGECQWIDSTDCSAP